MNFLILSVTAGEGHNSTARAIRGELQKLSADCTVLDTFNYVAPEIGKIISEGYLLVTEKAKYAYRIGYGMAEKRRQKDPVISLGKAALTKELASYINNEDDFDAIVFTHPFPGILLDAMLEHNIIKKKTVGILTDFTFHPYWEYCTRNNYVAVPDRLLLPQARRKGFRDSQIIPLGIPINPKFSTSVPKEKARRRLGLDEHTKTLLLMGGSMGYGNIADNVTAIDKMDLGSDFQMIIVCGNNDSARKETEKIAKTSRHKMLVTGFVDYVSLLMDASDCIVTKPGGLTTSESLAKGLPMIIVNPIPGQEERNTEFLLNNGCAAASSKTCPLEECIYQLFTSEKRLAAMKQCISEVAKPHSAENLAHFLIDLAHTPFISDDSPAKPLNEDIVYFDKKGNLYK